VLACQLHILEEAQEVWETLAAYCVSEANEDQDRGEQERQARESIAALWEQKKAINALLIPRMTEILERLLESLSIDDDGQENIGAFGWKERDAEYWSTFVEYLCEISRSGSHKVDIEVA
jgi:hypothetical protein